jgi:tetratricopeptide (TPR) repeat protein
MRFAHLLRGLSVLVLLLAIAVPSVLAQATRGRLTGRVFDGGGEPLAGVTIEANSPSRAQIATVTEGDGRFSMIGFSSGQWTITAEIDGYQGGRVVTAVSQQGAATANFNLNRILSPFERLVGLEALEGLDTAALEADLNAADDAFDTQDYDTAIAAYNQLLSVLPSMTYLHLNIGNAHRGNGDYETAIAAYEHLTGDPDRGEQAKVEIARTRLSMGDFDAAADIATAGANASREDLFNLGEVGFAQGDMETAIGWYEKATAIDPNWEKPWFKLALVSLNLGDFETAKQHFQKVIDIAPSSEEGVQAQATLSALP